MLPSKIVMLAAGLAVVFATTAARAVDVEAANVEERHAMYLDMSGKMHKFTLNDKGHAMMMKSARALATGAIIYRAGGKFYLLEDKKMGNGSMMFADMQTWTSDRLSVGTR
jgi:outer membrane lipoprotein-sorting protein